MSQHTPYGLWPSPLSPASMAGALRLDGVAFDSDGRRIVWLEGRSGQGVLVCSDDSEAPRDLTTDQSVRARVGYGGGDFTVGGGHVYFVATDGRLYRQPLTAGPARAITPGFGRCCSPRLSPDGRWLLYIHTDEDADCVAVVDAEGHLWPRRLATGHDFFMWPRWSPRGDAIAYVCWDHPSMPWDGTELHLLPVMGVGPAGPEVGPPLIIAGSETVAIGQPEFAPDGRALAYISDATGWNQLWLYDLAARTHRQLTQDEADHGAPAWSYEQRSYTWSDDGKALIYRRDERGFQRLCRLDLATGTAAVIGADLADYIAADQVCAAPTDGRVVFVGSTAVVGPRLVASDATTGTATVLRRGSAEHVPAEALSIPTAVHWLADDGDTVHGLYYPPASDQVTATGPAPLVVLVHGGPTSHQRAGYNGQAQFLATRGYGVLAVNYRGSTGHGRAYMDKLRGNWGLHDVTDSVSGARHLIDAGQARTDQIVIMGGSAGGFTVLQALVEQPTFFTAGVCLYGIADQFAMAAETHKFEARYLDGLLGPLPEAAAVYRARSPLFHADRIVRPLAIFQGADDTVVPKNQSDSIVAALARRGVPHEYHVYAGEGHGWRKRETIEAFYTALDAFLRRYVVYA
ncbi:MAG: S9 family peptidase [Chloroflexi bacterium]|nr:S9 family peptidase [Chloroflexota bacterium]